MAHAVAAVIRAVSRVICLERLDGVTIAVDYEEALACLDRGYEGARLPVATRSSEIAGVAMSVKVRRGGVVKAHLVFDAAAIAPILEAEHPLFAQALSLVAHECGHVADLKRMDEAFPGLLLQRQYLGSYEALVAPLGEVAWEEYAACRASALFAREETGRYVEGLLSVLPVALGRAEAAIRAYRLHGDLGRVLLEAGNPLCEPLRMASYLLGHLHGSDWDMDQAPAAREAIAGSPYASLIDRLGSELRRLWETIPEWLAPSVFLPLQALFVAALQLGRIEVHHLPDGSCRVNTPFSPRTMPDFVGPTVPIVHLNPADRAPADGPSR